MRYLVFGGTKYYASGGGYDYLGSFEDQIIAEKFCLRIKGRKYILEKAANPAYDELATIEWAHIFDTKFAVVVFRVDEPYGRARASLGVI